MQKNTEFQVLSLERMFWHGISVLSHEMCKKRLTSVKFNVTNSAAVIMHSRAAACPYASDP